MTGNLDLFNEPSSPEPRKPERRAKKSSLGKNLVIFVALVATLGFVGPRVVALFSGAPDFPGPGSGSAQVQIASGETLAQIGNSLKDLGVVASVDGFISAASENSQSASIAPGAYNLRLEMKSADAILALLDPANRVVTKVVIPEGKRVAWTIETLATRTGLPLADFEAAVANAASLGLPAYANGNQRASCFQQHTNLYLVQLPSR